MNGLLLCEDYFQSTALPELRREFPELLPHLAAGLVGNGSECFGYDDMYSRDHDWGIDFYIWTEGAADACIPQLEKWKQQLLLEHPPAFPRCRTDFGSVPCVQTVGAFYRSLIGIERCPAALREWLCIPEENLAMAVNGKVFYDGAGLFSQTREELLRHYPEELRLKRLSSCCMAIAQTGQYNYMRTVQRGEVVTANAILTRFVEHVSSFVFLWERVYRPYYKWSFRMLSELPLGKRIAPLLERLICCQGLAQEKRKEQEALIFAVTDILCDTLRSSGLTDSKDWFLEAHGLQLAARLTDPLLKSMPLYH